MQTDCTYLPYEQTGFFSATIIDYLRQKETLQPFYEHSVSLEGIKAAIQERQGFQQNRQALVHVLKQQYENIPTLQAVEQNIQSLLQTDTFTVTTAHQPVIFTGPLYFFYKIFHVIKIAGRLTEQLPDYKFVPVYYMGSEDADLDELGTINVNGKQYKWRTQQNGAVGRMKVDKAFIALLDELSNQVSVEKYGVEIINVFKQCYHLGVTVQQATLEVVNTLFGNYGLVVLIPDNPVLKSLFAPVIQKELTEQFSHAAIEETIAKLSQQYKVQAGGRDINLFYLIDDKRERIEKENDLFVVKNLDKSFTQAEILQDLETNPERFSPNVILRGALQEKVLPNIAFIGGGGELAYWLELKAVFKAVSIPYPVLVLRNSFLFVNRQQSEKIDSLNFNSKDFFKDERILINTIVKRDAGKQLTLENELQQTADFYTKELTAVTDKIDITLHDHVLNLHKKISKKLVELEKKMLRAERKKYEAQQRQIILLKAQLFPNGSLQERSESIIFFYARYGKELIEKIYQCSLTLEQQFAIIDL